MNIFLWEFMVLHCVFTLAVLKRLYCECWYASLLSPAIVFVSMWEHLCNTDMWGWISLSMQTALRALSIQGNVIRNVQLLLIAIYLLLWQVWD